MNQRLASPSKSASSLVLACLIMALSGCSVALFPDKEPLRIFTLPYHYQPPSVANDRAPALPVLKIVRPQANGVLSGKRMVIEPRAHELAAYSSVTWVTEAPLLLRDHLLRALRDDPRFATVVSDVSGSASEVAITSELKAFQEDRSGEEVAVRLYLQAQLVENGSRRTLATRDFHVKVPVEDGRIEATVAAFGQAADRLSGELADWTETALADD